jgi:hypothetical protein
VTSKKTPSNLYQKALPLKQVQAASRPGKEHGRSIGGHKFNVGQSLFFSPSIFEAATRKGLFRVVSLLPADGGDNQYRLKSETDGHERVVREGQLAVA